MTLPASGTISLNQTNVELARSGTQSINLNEAAVRNLSGRTSGYSDMDSLHGKTYEFALSLSAHYSGNTNLRTLCVNAGWNQSIPVSVTLNSGYYMYATSTGSYGLTINGSWPSGVTFINNGYVMAQGGTGGRSNNQNGYGGGAALRIESGGVTIRNNSYIGGGGGGGGGIL